jgi:hypothetical protein
MNRHKTLGCMIADLYKEHNDANFALVFEQAIDIQNQFIMQEGNYMDREGLLRQETHAYLVIKANLEKGMYR